MSCIQTVVGRSWTTRRGPAGGGRDRCQDCCTDWCEAMTSVRGCQLEPRLRHGYRMRGAYGSTAPLCFAVCAQARPIGPSLSSAELSTLAVTVSRGAPERCEQLSERAPRRPSTRQRNSTQRRSRCHCVQLLALTWLARRHHTFVIRAESVWAERAGSAAHTFAITATHDRATVIAWRACRRAAWRPRGPRRPRR